MGEEGQLDWVILPEFFCGK